MQYLKPVLKEAVQGMTKLEIKLEDQNKVIDGVEKKLRFEMERMREETYDYIRQFRSLE